MRAIPVHFLSWVLLGNLLVMGTAEAVRADLPVISDIKAAQLKESQPLPMLKNVDIGWNGMYRVGSRVPMTLTFETQKDFNGVVNLYVSDSDGNTVKHGPLTTGAFAGGLLRKQHYSTIIQIPKQAFALRIELKIVPLGTEEMSKRKDAKASFDEFPVDAEWIWNAPLEEALSSEREVWIELGESLRLKSLIPDIARDAASQPAIVAIKKKEFEPWISWDYQGVQGIAIASRLDPGIGGDLPDFYQMERWVQQGGNLLLSLDSKAVPLSKSDLQNEAWVAEREKYLRDSWSRLLPGKLTKNLLPLQQWSSWELFLNTDEPLVINEELRRNPPLIPVLSDIRGKVLLADGDTPLVIEHQLGLGRVVTCLVDLNAEPWRSWKKRDELLQRLIPWHIPTDAEAKFASSTSSQRLGYDDLAGQFVTALGTFPSVQRTPFWVLMSAALVFGVVWYFVQAVLLKTWNAGARLVTAAVVVTGATLGFAMLTGGFVSEVRLVANSAQVVDYNAMQGEYQGQSWLSVMSTNPRQINLQASVATNPNEKTEKPEQQLEWLGMPGKGWGGLDAPLATWTQGGEPYQIDSRGAAVQVLTLSPDLTKSFHERWRQPTEAVPTAPLVGHPGESLPRGMLKSELPFALKDAILIYDTWGVELGTVQTGQVIDLEQIRGRVASAGTIITGKRSKPTEASQSYDRANTEVPQILKLLLLHRAAGGTRYTGLFSRAWPLLDQSSSLTENQALILGKGPAPVKWKVGPSGEQVEALEPASDVCWYRLWLPVITNEEASETASAPTVIRLPGVKE